ncbi:MAG: hypothetical protein WAqPseu_02810 [Shewanella algae]|nr:hypothetical protein TUM4442_14530 [Shewanella algae]BCV48835.1 hypothetical protein TUM17382_15280 [Shewanella algae]BCV57539.1 hypothetical protein TUM17384_14840 [Shewanella algae]
MAKESNQICGGSVGITQARRMKNKQKKADSKEVETCYRLSAKGGSVKQSTHFKGKESVRHKLLLQLAALLRCQAVMMLDKQTYQA